jgi:general secretion pathway protein K
MNDENESGFALVAVIWIATLLAVVAFIFTAAVRAHIRSAAASIATAEAEAAAEAGISIAVLDIVQSARSGRVGRVAVNGEAIACRLPAGDAISIRVRDEAGRVDLNAASPALLAALFAGAGLAPEEAATRAQAIADFRDADDVGAEGRPEREAYTAAGLAHGPKNAPFAATEELSRVIGFDAETVRRLRPFVTVHSEQDGVDPTAAPDGLADVLARGARAMSTEGLEPAAETAVIPAHFRAASARRAFGIESEAVTGRGARFVRVAVVSLAAGRGGELLPGESRPRRPSSEPAYRLWRWQRGESFATGSIADAPPC